MPSRTIQYREPDPIRRRQLESWAKQRRLSLSEALRTIVSERLVAAANEARPIEAPRSRPERMLANLKRYSHQDPQPPSGPLKLVRLIKILNEGYCASGQERKRTRVETARLMGLVSRDPQGDWFVMFPIIHERICEGKCKRAGLGDAFASEVASSGDVHA